MIDLHSHILPELDDGAGSLREALAMARMAVDSGVRRMVVTPHCADDRRKEIGSALSLLKEALGEYHIPLGLYPGMEIFGTPDTARLLQEGKLLTLNGSRYPLVEFSFYSTGGPETQILQSILDAGFRPVVAHPERYVYIQESPELVNRWKKMGCLFQINRGSLLGRFGPVAQEVAAELVNRGFATVVASDAHSPRRRTPWLDDVRQLISREVSPTAAEYLLYRNPGSILRNEELPTAEPEWF